MTATPADAGSPSAGAETCACGCCAERANRVAHGRDPQGSCNCPDCGPHELCDCPQCLATPFQPCVNAPIGVMTNCISMGCEVKGCAVEAAERQGAVSLDDLSAAPSPEDTVEPTRQASVCHGIECLTECSTSHRAHMLAGALPPKHLDALPVVSQGGRPSPPATPPAVRTGEDDGADVEPTREDRAVAAGFVRRARAANSDVEVWDARDRIARDIAAERALAARPLVSGTANRDVARWLQLRVIARQERCPDSDVPSWESLNQFQRAGWLSWADELLALLGGDQDDEDGAR
jgi:hypothetical protein